MEMLMVAGLLAYFANFFAGKAKNARLAQLWFSTHRALLDENFALVGDDGKAENENPGLIKESESLYTLWCSGRTCCEGMLVELKMISVYYELYCLALTLPLESFYLNDLLS